MPCIAEVLLGGRYDAGVKVLLLNLEQLKISNLAKIHPLAEISQWSERKFDSRGTMQEFIAQLSIVFDFTLEAKLIRSLQRNVKGLCIPLLVPGLFFSISPR